SVFERAQSDHEQDNTQAVRQPNSRPTPSSRPAALTCGHVFHTDCITTWITSSVSATCPTCNIRSIHAPLALYLELEEEDVPHAVPSQRHRHRSQKSNIDDLTRQTEQLTLDSNTDDTVNAHTLVARELSLLSAALENQRNKIEELTAKVKLHKKKKGHLYAALSQKKTQIDELSRNLNGPRSQANRNART
ncbi:hypothetical protein LPJ73_006877, partial [Coemansia sp. RSA 2703]